MNLLQVLHTPSNLAYVLILILNVLLGVFIYKQRKVSFLQKKSVKTAIAFIYISIVVWLGLTFLIYVTSNSLFSTFGVKLLYSLGIIIALGFCCFVQLFVNKESTRVHWGTLLSLVLGFFLIASVLFSSFIIERAILSDRLVNKQLTLIVGNLFIPWLFLIFIFLLTLAYNAYSVYKKLFEYEKEMLKDIFLVVAVVLIIIFLVMVFPLFNLNLYYEAGMLLGVITFLSAIFILLQEYPFSTRFLMSRFLNYFALGGIFFFTNIGILLFVYNFDAQALYGPLNLVIGFLLSTLSVVTLFVIQDKLQVFFENLMHIKIRELENISKEVNTQDPVMTLERVKFFFKKIQQVLSLEGVLIKDENLKLMEVFGNQEALFYIQSQFPGQSVNMIFYKNAFLYIYKEKTALLVPSRITKKGLIILYGHELAKEELDIVLKILEILNIYLSKISLEKQYKNQKELIKKEVELRTQKLQKSLSELQKKHEKLKVLDRAKSEFITTIGHQLRTPISVVLGYVQMIHLGEFGTPTSGINDVLARIKRNMLRLRGLIEDILNVNIIELGQLKLNKEQTNIVVLLENIVQDFHEEAKAKNLRLYLKSNLPAEKFNVKIDKGKLTDAISSLIENAIKYTKEGFVELGVSEKDNNILIWVKDTGVGIPKDKQKEVFKKFVRFSNAKKISPDGTGIGLFLAKKIIEAHNGKIWFNSKEGDGTIFYISLPQN